MKFPPEIFETLCCYVYVYIDPRDGKPFYIGKGCANRAFDHLDEDGEAEKNAVISAIREAGLAPTIEILRYGMTDTEAALVEAAAIDLLGLKNLTNQVRGQHSGTLGRILASELALTLAAPPVVIEHKAILITINRLYRSGMSPLELCEATRGVWKLGRKSTRHECAELGMAVYQGVVREVYRIKCWHKAGTLAYQTRKVEDVSRPDRVEFEGEVAEEDVRCFYLGKSVREYLGESSQNPVRYVNF